jgi:hypothetical protein
VVLAGGEGSLLLIQPDSIVAATNKLASTFISPPSIIGPIIQAPFLVHAGPARQQPIAHAAVLAGPTAGACTAHYSGPAAPKRPYTVFGARQYWIYDRPNGG